MKSLSEIYNIYLREAEEAEIERKSLSKRKYNLMAIKTLKDICKLAGLEMNKPVLNTYTEEIGELSYGIYNLLPDYIIFKRYKKDGSLTESYKVITRSRNTEKIVKALKRDYVMYNKED